MKNTTPYPASHVLISCVGCRTSVFKAISEGTSGRAVFNVRAKDTPLYIGGVYFVHYAAEEIYQQQLYYTRGGISVSNIHFVSSNSFLFPTINTENGTSSNTLWNRPLLDTTGQHMQNDPSSQYDTVHYLCVERSTYDEFKKKY